MKNAYIIHPSPKPHKCYTTWNCMIETIIAIVAMESIEDRIDYTKPMKGLIVFIDLIAMITTLDILEWLF